MTRHRLTHLRWPALIAVLAGITLGVPAHAEPSWNASIGAEADESGASTADADIGWSPTSRFGLWFAAGRASGADDLGEAFDSQTVFAGVDWRFSSLFGMSLGYDVWDDTGTYEKRTAHATLYVGNERGHVGVIAQSVQSETTAELALLRRSVSIAFDGTGYGAEILFSGDRVSAYASYVTYDYDDSTDRLLTFLANPNLSLRPRLETLLGSSLTAAAALLDYSATVGADTYVGKTRIGLSFSALRDIVTEADSHSLGAEVEWPLTGRWSARLVAGVNDSDVESSVFFGGARVLYHSR